MMTRPAQIGKATLLQALLLCLLLLSLPSTADSNNLPAASEADAGNTATAQHALYINYWQASEKSYRKSLLINIKNTDIDALVIDVKNEFGQLSYLSDIPLALQIGAYKKAYIRDGKAFLQVFKNEGLYLIARIPVFKDDLLARKYPQWAIKKADQSIWLDGQGLAWTDPFHSQVQRYNTDIAESAAEMGFDEVHLDYVRFPSINDLSFKRQNTQANRLQAIQDFLQNTQQRLSHHGVKLSVATYGYVCWNRDDTFIGHKVAELAKYVDYIAPMLYPSSFHLGIPGFRLAVDHPYNIVYLSLKHCAKLAGIDSRRFRPWLQAFRDYAFDKRAFTHLQIQQQINAAKAFNSNGWMLWNPASRYTNYLNRTAEEKNQFVPSTDEQ